MTATAIGAYATAAALKALIGTTDDDDDALLGLICDRVNQTIESITKQYVGPIASATYLYDGNNLRRIYLPMPVDVTDGSPPAGSQLDGVGGARAVTLVEAATYTGGDFTTLDATGYFLRQRATVSGPYKWLVLSDRPVGVWHHFHSGYANVRVTMTAGWTAIPDDMTELALLLAQRAWNARSAGQQDVTGYDGTGQPTMTRYLSIKDRDLLRRYSLRPPT